ncbi:MAG: SH3 domain-containing protein, partial [Clostridia bacterium]|nr:SH3 domain-containing protein [Clostridia bacterium]
YFNIPFNEPESGGYSARVVTNGGNLNIRQRPDVYSPVVGKAPNGAVITVINGTGDWLLIRYKNMTGYVYKYYVQ